MGAALRKPVEPSRLFQALQEETLHQSMTVGLEMVMTEVLEDFAEVLQKECSFPYRT